MLPYTNIYKTNSTSTLNNFKATDIISADSTGQFTGFYFLTDFLNCLILFPQFQ